MTDAPSFQQSYFATIAASILPPDRRPIPEWIADNRILPRGSAEEGRKKVSRTPAIAPVYHWFRDPFIREIVVLKSAQIGYTDAMVDLILWVAVNDPSPTAIFFADQNTAKKMMRARIRPALEGIGLIKHRTGEKEQDATSYEIRLGNGFHLVASWASSISGTASMSFKYLFCDELDKPGYMSVGTEGDTIGRIRERAETYPDHKILWGSTPTVETGLISKEFSGCDARFDFCAPCPACGAYQPLKFHAHKTESGVTGSVIWDGGRNATRQQLEETARYQCGPCGAKWTEEQRMLAVAAGIPMIRDGDDRRPRTVGYSISRLASLFPGGKLAAMVSNWLKSHRDPGKLQNFVNSSLGEVWVQRVSAGQDEAQQAIMSCKTTLPKGVVPDEAVALTCGIDVQQRGFWYRVRAWARDTTSWGIDEGFLDSWDDVAKLLLLSEYHRKGVRVPIWRALIDTGGGKEEGAYVSRTEETYNFIRQHQGRGVQLFGSKGSSRSMPTKMKMGAPIEKTPSGKPIPGGIRIVSINTTLVKDAIEARIEQTRTDGGPGSWFIHADTPDWFAKQVTAEEKRRQKNGSIEWVQIRRDNHMLDCEVMCFVLADPEFQGGVRLLARAIEHTQQQKQRKAAQQTPQEDNPWLRGIGGG